MEYEYPESFARFYDLIYNHQRGVIDKEYFLNEIRQSGGRILDIGVGTGRIFADALKEGADIYGIDISQSMIDILSRKINGEHLQRISRQNFVDFKYDFKFDLIIAPFHVFMHLIEKDTQLKAINNVYDHLNKNGKFIFDAFVPDLKQLIRKINNYIDYSGEYEPGKKIKRIVSTKPDLINQIIYIKFRLEWDEDNDIGDISYIYFRVSDTIYVPTKMLPWADKSSVLHFLGSHSIDTICWLTEKKPKSIKSVKKEGILTGIGINTADMYLCIIDFEDGITAVVENSWTLPHVHSEC